MRVVVLLLQVRIRVAPNSGQLEDVLPLGVVPFGHVEVGEIDYSGRFGALDGEKTRRRRRFVSEFELKD